MVDMLFDHPLLRSEFDWVCVDGSGFVGYFATAGAGPIPAGVAMNASLFDSLLEDVLAMEPRGEAIQDRAIDRDDSEWCEVARRGLFAYDWRVEVRRYELVARPSSPVQYEELVDDRLKLAAALTRLPVSFADIASFVATPGSFGSGS